MNALRLPRRVIAVRGAGARAFLDNLLTHSVGQAAPRRPVYAALLSPQGKVLTDLIAWDDAHGLLLDVAEARADDLARRLRLFKLRAKVEIAEAALGVFAFAGDTPDPRLAALGTRALLPEGPAFDPAAFTAYEAHRVALGVPDLATDAGVEEIFALEGLLEELNGVDFKKGCFVGQENVSRMKRRATTRRKLCRIAYAGPAPAFGSPVLAGGVAIGEMRGGIEGVGLALLRLDRAREKLEAGEGLEVGGRPVRLDPPDWLLLPTARDGAD